MLANRTGSFWRRKGPGQKRRRHPRCTYSTALDICRQQIVRCTCPTAAAQTCDLMATLRNLQMHPVRPSITASVCRFVLARPNFGRRVYLQLPKDTSDIGAMCSNAGVLGLIACIDSPQIKTMFDPQQVEQFKTMKVCTPSALRGQLMLMSPLSRSANLRLWVWQAGRWSV